MITILLCAFNEEHNPYFWQTLKLIQDLEEKRNQLEVIVGFTDGGDRTRFLLLEKKIRFIEVQTRKRADRYNEALKLSSGAEKDWILLHHPRSLLCEEAILALKELHSRVKWGAFTHQFDDTHPLLTFTSWWSNAVRGDLKGIFYLDHCLFVRKDLFLKIGGVPSVEIFEDTLLSLALSRHSEPVRLSWKSVTSSIRFKTQGIWKQALKNQLLKIKFLLNLSQDQQMNAEYERGVNLNTSVEGNPLP